MRVAARIPSLQPLVAFEAAVRLRSYSRAGRELGLSHGAISLRMRQLEDITGLRLFERVGQEMRPTPQSLPLQAQVRHLVPWLHAAFGVSRHGTPALDVVVDSDLASLWLGPRIADWFERDGARTVVWRTEDPAPGPPRNRLVLGHGSAAAGGPEVRDLRSEEIFPVCSPGYAARWRLREPEDLAGCRRLQLSSLPWRPWLHAVGLDLPEDGPAFDDARFALAAAEAGAGVTLARGLLVQDRIAEGLLVKPFQATVRDPWGYRLSGPAGSLSSEGPAQELIRWLEAKFA